MEIVTALKEFGITGFDAVLLIAIAYLARFFLTRYDADITSKTELAKALFALTDSIKEMKK